MVHRLNCTILAAWACVLAGPAVAADNSAQSGQVSGGVMQGKQTGDATAKRQTLTLSDQQQKTIIDAIVERHTHQATPKTFKAEVGASVSSAINIHGMPPRLASEVPDLKDYSYAHLDKNIVIVDAMQKKVAAVVPLPANLARESKGTPSNAKAAAHKAAKDKVGGLADLKPEQQRAIYQSTTAQPQPVPQQPLMAGKDVPAGMTLQPLPTEAAAQSPELQGLQYAKLQDGRVILVDPKSHKVAGIITQNQPTTTGAGQ